MTHKQIINKLTFELRSRWLPKNQQADNQIEIEIYADGEGQEFRIVELSKFNKRTGAGESFMRRDSMEANHLILLMESAYLEMLDGTKEELDDILNSIYTFFNVKDPT